MSMTFSDLIAHTDPQVPDLPDSWKQGRTAYGGLTAALMYARTHAHTPDLPPLRSALINFTGPVSAPPVIATANLRQGRNVTTMGSRGDIDGKAVCTGTFSFGASRKSHVRVDLPAPEAEKPESYDRFNNTDSPFVPAFLSNFDMHLIEGNRPMEQGERGYIRCWARHKDEKAWGTEAGLLCLADILPPAAFAIMKQLAPVSSMTWICNILRDPATEDGWYQVEADLTAALDGYSSQVMRMWNSRGELVVEGMQSITIFA